MIHASPLTAASLALCAGLAACGEAGHPRGYRGAVVEDLADDLVAVSVEISAGGEGQEAADRARIDDYARCAVAQYALGQGFGFARHVRTATEKTGGVWRAEATYSISPALPRGLRTIDTEVTVADCREQDIPLI